MSRQRKAERVPPEPPGGTATADNSQLWITRAALGLAGLALVGIVAFLLGHQQGADSVVEALQSQGVQTLPQEPDTYPTDDQESADEVQGEEALVEDGVNEDVPAEGNEPSDVEAVDAEDGGLDEDWGVVEVGDDSAGVAVEAADTAADTANVAVAVNAADAAATTLVDDSGSADTAAEPVDAPEADVWAMASEPEMTEPEAALPEAAQPGTALPEPVEPQFAEPVMREVVQEAQPEPYVQAEPVEAPAPVAEPRLYSVDPQQTTQQADTGPGQVEPQEIGSNALGTVGEHETVLVAGG